MNPARSSAADWTWQGPALTGGIVAVIVVVWGVGILLRLAATINAPVRRADEMAVDLAAVTAQLVTVLLAKDDT